MAGKKRHQNQNNGKINSTRSPSSRNKSVGKNETPKDEHKSLYSVFVEFGIPYLAVITGLALLIGYIHFKHISSMFENDRHFSHLSTLEREFAFRTEMGLYYSYYKTMIESPTFLQGLHSVMNDNITEYPLTINTLKRFNLYPEVVLAAGFRVYTSVMGWMNLPTKLCWTVNRGGNLSPVQSCEGFGDPAYFYTDNVFYLNGLQASIFFLFGTYLSGSVFGGLMSIFSLFYNLGESTRVQWTPPLRESFAYPFLVIQLFIISYILRISRPTMKHSLLVAGSTVLFMLPWQFAQFALLTQSLAVFAVYALRFIGSQKFKVIIIGQSLGLFASFVLLFGNEMLLTSYFFSALVILHIIVFLEPVIEKLRHILLIWLAQGGLLVVGLLGIKFLVSKILKVGDDAHIGDILRSKFTDFANFHTRLYTCAAEFDFLGKEPIVKLTKTLLLPSCIIAIVFLLCVVLMNEYKAYTNQQTADKNNEIDVKYRYKEHAELVYHVFQMLAYMIMTFMIMRLKLFWTPHLCLLTSLLASPKLVPVFKDRWHHLAVLGLLVSGMSVQGYWNLQKQWKIQGEFSNANMEEMIEWVKASTEKNAVFAGPMATMATVKLCTGRPIVNHPHYEDAGLRERTKKVYSMYSRRPRNEIHRMYRELRVQYAILEQSWCHRSSSHGCTMPEIWDTEDVEYRGLQPVCQIIDRSPEPEFRTVFRNSVYHILRVM